MISIFPSDFGASGNENGRREGPPSMKFSRFLFCLLVVVDVVVVVVVLLLLLLSSPFEGSLSLSLSVSSSSSSSSFRSFYSFFSLGSVRFVFFLFLLEDLESQSVGPWLISIIAPELGGKLPASFPT